MDVAQALEWLEVGCVVIVGGGLIYLRRLLLGDKAMRGENAQLHADNEVLAGNLRPIGSEGRVVDLHNQAVIIGRMRQEAAAAHTKKIRPTTDGD